MNKIGFPGLDWWFEIDPTAFTLFGIKIQWYGIIIAFGMILAILLFYRLATKKENIPGDNIFSVALLALPMAIIGARAAYVFTRWDYYGQTDFLTVINIRNGGLAIYGGIIGGFIALIIYNKFKKTRVLPMLDAVGPALMVGQIIGRWGNFINAEAYGYTGDIENLPWRMWIEQVEVNGKILPGEHLVHPTFLYESLWNLIGLAIILFVFYRKKKFDGEIFCLYIGWYGIGRFVIEQIRVDSSYVFGTGLKYSAAVGLLCFIGAIIAAFIFYRRGKKQSEELAEYKANFTAAKIASESEGDALGTIDFDAASEQIEDESDYIAESEVTAASTEREELTGDPEFEGVYESGAETNEEDEYEDESDELL